MSKESRIWPDTGIEPADGEEVVEGGEEYPAEFINWILWALTTDVDALFDDVSTNATDISTLRTDVDANDTDIADLSTAKLDQTDYTPVSDVDGEISQAATSVSTLDGVVDTHDSDIDTVESNFSSHESAGNPHGDSASTDYVDNSVSSHAINSSAHHSRYSDTEAVGAVSDSVNFGDIANVTKIAFGEVSVNASDFVRIRSGYDPLSNTNVIVGDATASANSSDRGGGTFGINDAASRGIAVGDVGYRIVHNGIGQYDIFVYNETANSIKINYSFYEVDA